MTRPYPRLDGADARSIRDKIDRIFVDEIRRLEDCFYGTAQEWDAEGLASVRATDGWRDGVSCPYVIGGRTFDVRADAAASRALFDRIHGALWQLHELCLIAQAEADTDPDAARLRYRERWDPDPADPDNMQRRITVDRKAELRAVIRAAREANIDFSEIVPAGIRQAVVNYLKA